MPPAPALPPPGTCKIARGRCGGGGAGGMVQFSFEFDTFFYIQFKNTYNLIFLGFKVPSERFFHKNFKTGLNF
jgi:hypothetical protein